MEIYHLLDFFPHNLVVTVSQCAKRIHVKKRMADGLAKRGLQRTVAAEEDEGIVTKKDTKGGSNMLSTLLRFRKGININQRRIQGLTVGSVKKSS